METRVSFKREAPNITRTFIATTPIKKTHRDSEDSSNRTSVKPPAHQSATSLESRNRASEFYRTPQGVGKFRLSRVPWSWSPFHRATPTSQNQAFVRQTCTVQSLSVLWTGFGHEHFQTPKCLHQKGTTTSWMDGDATADWLHIKYGGEVEKERGQGKTGNMHISEQVRSSLSVFALFLSQHPSCTVSKTSGCYNHALHTTTQKTQYFCYELSVMLWGFFPKDFN